MRAQTKEPVLSMRATVRPQSVVSTFTFRTAVPLRMNPPAHRAM